MNACTLKTTGLKIVYGVNLAQMLYQIIPVPMGCSDPVSELFLHYCWVTESKQPFCWVVLIDTG